MRSQSKEVPLPLTSFLAVVVLSGCATVAVSPAPRRVFAVPGHALLASERSFAVASDVPARSSSGGFMAPLHVEGVVAVVGRRHGPRAVSRDRNFRGRAELVILAERGPVSVQFDAPSGALPVRAGQWVSLEAHALRDGARAAYLLSVWDRRGKLLFAGYAGSRIEPSLSIPGWSIALGPAVEAQRVCGGEVARRTLRVRGPGGEAVLWPGYRSLAPLGGDGRAYEVDVLAARSVDAPCAAADAGEVGVFVRLAER